MHRAPLAFLGLASLTGCTSAPPPRGPDRPGEFERLAGLHDERAVRNDVLEWEVVTEELAARR